MATSSKTARKSPTRLRCLEDFFSSFGTWPFSQSQPPNKSGNSPAQMQRRVANDLRGVFAADAAGVDDEMIEQGVVDVGLEIGFHVAGPGLFLDRKSVV